MEALAAVEDPEAIPKQVRDLQQQSRQAADVPRPQGEALWKRFKKALCARARTLKDSIEWGAAAGEMKRLKAEWKTIGPVKKSRSEALWQRFRGAADHFFARFAQRHDIALGERVAARESICSELEALGPGSVAAPSPDDAQAASAAQAAPSPDGSEPAMA